MLSPISMQSMPLQQAQPTQAKPQAAPAAAASQPASLQPDTVSLSSQAHAIAGHDGDGDGH